ncbi:MAG: sugar transferase [Leptolyngbya sp. SIO4C1]|nr:sugar transferase [Leptolyngbya sp. SIO4C1]
MNHTLSNVSCNHLHTPTSSISHSDLRAPAFSIVRKGAVFKWARIASLLVLDASFLALAWLAANHWGMPAASPWGLEANPYSLLPVVGVIVSIIAARGLYAEGDRRRDYVGLAKAVMLGNALLLLIAFFYAPHQFVSRSHFLLFLLLSLLATCSAHLLVDLGIKLLRRQGVITYPVFLIADLEDRRPAVDLINQESRYLIQGVASARSLDRSERAATFARLKRLGITEAFVTWDAIKRRLFLSWHFQSRGITLRVIPVRDEPLFEGASCWMIGGLASLSFNPAMLTGIDFQIKRIFDFCCALLILMLASPLYLAIMLLIKLDSPGPLFYKQTRVGLHGNRFEVWKFRSMVVDADQRQKELEAFNKTKDGILFKMEDDPRITRVGKFLRKYSLDELPQLFNVLMGQMSLVGPRPLPLRDVEKFAEHHFIRHEVLPGITGLWQVSGRSDIEDFEDVIKLDLQYIERWSLCLDLSILLKTVGVVLKKSGAY